MFRLIFSGRKVTYFTILAIFSISEMYAIENVFDSLQKNIESVDFKFRIISRFNPLGLDLNKPDAQVPYLSSTDMDYIGKQGGFYIKAITTFSRPKAGQDTTVLAYNGEVYQEYMPNGALHITRVMKNAAYLDLRVGVKNGFYAPFWFLETQGIVNPYHVDHPWLLKLGDRFKDFLLKAERKEEEMLGPWLCKVYTFPFEDSSPLDPPPPWTQLKDLEVRVYLAKDQALFPVKWQFASKSRGVLSEYLVDELSSYRDKNGKVYPYAKAGTYFSYKMSDQKTATKPVLHVSYQVLNIIINDNVDTEEHFTIDPSQASTIYDIDLDKGISVPK